MPSYRPETVREVDGDTDILLLMRTCWKEIPSDRPDFSTICRTLAVLNGGRYDALANHLHPNDLEAK